MPARYKQSANIVFGKLIIKHLEFQIFVQNSLCWCEGSGSGSIFFPNKLTHFLGLEIGVTCAGLFKKQPTSTNVFQPFSPSNNGLGGGVQSSGLNGLVSWVLQGPSQSRVKSVFNPPLPIGVLYPCPGHLSRLGLVRRNSLVIVSLRTFPLLLHQKPF